MVRFGLVLIMLLLVLAAPYSATAGDVPREVQDAAQEGLANFLKGRTYGSVFNSIGFMNQDEIDHAEIGEIYQVYAVDTNIILTDNSGIDSGELIIPINQWEAVIQYKGEPKSILTINFDGKKWRAVKIGAMILANELSMVKKVWPEARGYHTKLIRLYQPATELIQLSINNKIKGYFNLISMRKKRHEKDIIYFNENYLQDSKQTFKEIKMSPKYRSK